MRRIFLSAIAAFAITSFAEAQVAMPAASPLQFTRQDFGLGKIEITYSRPAVKGRSMFGEKTDLAPAGQLWRTGANAATKIRFTDNVMIGGKSIDSGTYSIFTIPAKNEWEVILNKNVNASVNDYKQAEDIVRIKARPEKMNHNVESFTIQVDNVAAESAELHLMWGNTLVRVPMTTSVKDRIRTQLEAGLQGDKKPHFAAANFYYEYDKNYAKALENVNKAIESNQKAFWMHMLKARIQKEMGDKNGAKETAQNVVKLATDAKNDDYVRMANDLMKKM